MFSSSDHAYISWLLVLFTRRSPARPHSPQPIILISSIHGHIHLRDSLHLLDGSPQLPLFYFLYGRDRACLRLPILSTHAYPSSGTPLGRGAPVLGCYGEGSVLPVFGYRPSVLSHIFGGGGASLQSHHGLDQSPLL